MRGIGDLVMPGYQPGGAGAVTPLYQLDPAQQAADKAALDAANAISEQAAQVAVAAGCDIHPDITAQIIANQGPEAYFGNPPVPRGPGILGVPPGVRAAYNSGAGIDAIMRAWIAAEGPKCANFGTQIPQTMFQPVPSVSVGAPAVSPVLTVQPVLPAPLSSGSAPAASPGSASGATTGGWSDLVTADSLGFGFPNWAYAGLAAVLIYVMWPKKGGRYGG